MSNTNEEMSALSGVKRSSAKDQEVLQDAETAEPVRKQMKLDHKPTDNSSPHITVTTIPMTTPPSKGKQDDILSTFLSRRISHHPSNETNSKKKTMKLMRSLGSSYLPPFFTIVTTQLKSTMILLLHWHLWLAFPIFLPRCMPFSLGQISPMSLLGCRMGAPGVCSSLESLKLELSPRTLIIRNSHLSFAKRTGGASEGLHKAETGIHITMNSFYEGCHICVKKWKDQVWAKK